MTMNFFKKVITFFSVIWNAILWRKTDKKAKQANKAAEKEDQAEKDTHQILETEKLFVDVPLHSPEANNPKEQEFLIGNEIPAFAPTVAHNIESSVVADSGIKEYSSGVQLFGFEDETSPSLSFFSEPARDREELETPRVSVKNENGKVGEEDSIIYKMTQIEPEASAVDEIIVNKVNECLELSISEELPTPPSDPVPAGVWSGRKILSEFTALGDQSASIDFPSSTSMEILLPTGQEDRALLEMQPSIDDMQLFSTDHGTITPIGKINLDLYNLSSSGDIHLFDHDNVVDAFAADEEYGGNKTSELPEHVGILVPESCGTAEKVSKCVEFNQTVNANADVAAISSSVSSTQALADTIEHTTDSCSIYSTNYMVKSDSLVNFLPEGASDLDVNYVAELADILLETAAKSPTQEEKEIPCDYNICILQEGGLEEMMCTPRGVLKLSGDHHVDCTDENDDPKKNHDVKTAVDDFIMDAFSFEEPLLITHHLEGSILEESSLQIGMTDDSPIVKEILKTVETELRESVDDLDAMTCEKRHTISDSIGRCRSIIRNGPDLPNFPMSRKDLKKRSPTLGHDEKEKEEDRKSPCKLSQFTKLHLDDGPDHIGHFKRNEIFTPSIPTVRYGEIPSSSGITEPVSSETETYSANHTCEEGPTEQLMTDPQISDAFLNGHGWQVAMPISDSQVAGMQEHEHTSLSLLNKHFGPMLGDHQKSGRDMSVDKSSDTRDGEDLNDYYPFIDCSSYLFRIPEEIRKETSFNPCVGAAPSRRSRYSNNANLEPASEYGEYNNKYPNTNSRVPTCVGTVPLIDTCTPEEYKDSGVAKLPDVCNQTPNVGTFWETSSGLPHHGGQQQGLVGYPVNCSETYYEGEDPNVLPAITYGNDHTNGCTTSESYGYINPYGEVEFPMLRIPLCTPPSPSSFMQRGTMAPLVFPIGPINFPGTGHLSSLVNLDPARSEQYSIPQSWGGYPSNAYVQNVDEGEHELSSVVEVRSMAPLENLSCAGANDEDDDVDKNPIPDPYFQLAENNSLHTVKSKADSYAGSLFCESLRSLISHNTENENIFPSFSCSSVQGCCPSIVLQSCETTLSNDSLPSIIVEETNYSKSVDEDYLATEKFMNDVNTALNESVLDQIQGRNDLHSNLLGRGDGSMAMSSGQSGQRDHLDIDTQENDLMLRNSLGENVSINNSKLTLLDGVLGAETGGNQPNLINYACELDCESSISLHDHCRAVLDSLLENVLTTLVDCVPANEQHIVTAETTADCRENLDEAPNQTNPDRDVVVQSMMFIEGTPDELRGIWTKSSSQKQEMHDSKEKKVSLNEVVGAVGVSEVSDEETVKDSGDNVVDNPQSSATDDIANRRSRRNRRRKKKLSDTESGIEPEPCAEVAGVGIGDGVGTPHNQLIDTNCDKINESPAVSSEPGQIRIEAASSNPKADEELLASGNTREPSKCDQDLAQIVDEGNEHQEDDDEPGENPGNSYNRRKRNRRRKRKN